MKRKIWLDGERFASLEVRNEGEIDIYQLDESTDERRKEIVNAMTRNGYSFFAVETTRVAVKHDWFIFDGYSFGLYQCSDIFDWFADSKKGDFTYYYDRIVFHHPDGRFYAAYIEDTSNYIGI